MDASEPSLSSLVYGELKRELNEGLLRPGEFIDLKAFSKKLGISMSPLRDALIRLEGEGFLQIYPRRGVMVRRLEYADIRNIYEVVGALEAAVAADSVEELGPEDFARMEGLCSLMDSSLDRGSFSDCAKANRDFHDIYLGRSNNPELLPGGALPFHRHLSPLAPAAAHGAALEEDHAPRLRARGFRRIADLGDPAPRHGFPPFPASISP